MIINRNPTSTSDFLIDTDFLMNFFSFGLTASSDAPTTSVISSRISSRWEGQDVHWSLQSWTRNVRASYHWSDYQKILDNKIFEFSIILSNHQESKEICAWLDWSRPWINFKSIPWEVWPIRPLISISYSEFTVLFQIVRRVTSKLCFIQLALRCIQKKRKSNTP